MLPAAPAVLARASGENFPVALWILPRDLRRELRALYGYARLVDEIGDEVAGDRLAQLDALERDLERVFRGEPARHPLLRALAPGVRAHALPEAPFRALIEANRRDQRVRGYASWEDLAGYCALSANPVGRLVLHLLGAAGEENLKRSDAVCTALQLVEHCQDVGEDAARGRIYLPAEDLARFGCAPRELSAREASPALRAVLEFEIRRVRALLGEGADLVRRLRGAGRIAVAGFVAGGHAAADGVERAGFDVLARPPRTRRRDVLRHGLRLWLGRGAP